jgi:hypothetical protein
MDTAATGWRDATPANAGAGCLALFGLRFGLGGLAALWTAGGQWMSGRDKPRR